MFCMACGAQNDGTSQFCAKCGSPLVGATPATPSAEPVGQGYSQPVQQMQYGQVPGQPYGQPSVSYIPPAPVEGCMGAAWKDITSTPGWIKRVLLLCLINIVPFLGSFATNGYCLRWARDLSFGKRETMPVKIFRKHEIATGFKAFLVSFMIGMIWAIVAIAAIALLVGLFALMNGFAALIILVLLLLLVGAFTLIIIVPVIQACVMRMAVTGILEKGLNVKLVWDIFRRSMGSLIGASLLPLIIVGVIRSVISFILTIISTAVIQDNAQNAINTFSKSISSALNPYNMMMNSNASVQYLNQGIELIIGTLVFLVFFWIVSYVIDCLFNLFGALWSYRSVGHWAARFAPEWAQESEEGTLDGLQEESLATQQAYASAGFADQAQPLG